MAKDIFKFTMKQAKEDCQSSWSKDQGADQEMEGTVVTIK